MKSPLVIKQFKSKYYIQYTLSLFNYTFYVSCHSKKNGWLRLFGKGIKWKHEDLGLIFSERIGKTKYIKIRKWIIGYLE